MEYKGDLIKIYKHFGKSSQKEKLYEEIMEYFCAIPESKNEHEEMCDIWVVVTSILLNDLRTRPVIDHKIKRTLQRMKDGYYEKQKAGKYGKKK
jgi:hypothetical protein